MSLVTSMVVALLCAGLDFAPESIEGLGAGPSPGFNQRDHFSFIHAPLSNSERPDLLTATHLYLAEGENYSAAHRHEYPHWDQPPVVDAWEDQLYVRSPGRLRSYRFVDGDWTMVLDQTLEWPDDGMQRVPMPRDGVVRPLRFERFLYDLFGDSRPELVLLGPDGLMVYVQQEDSYSLHATWNILPAPRLQPATDVALWPRNVRRFSLPGWEQAARVLIEPGQLRVLVREQDSQRQTRYRQLRYALRREDPEPRMVEDELGAPLRTALRPTRLNERPGIQLAGVSWELARGGGFSIPRVVYELSLDGGATVEQFQAPAPPGWRARGPAVDWDGDGRLDLVVEHTHLYEGGARESLARVLTRSAVDHSIAIHRQDGAGFEKEASVTKRLTLALDRPPFRPCIQFERYRNGDRLSMAGDFDGDGWRDLAVRSDQNKLDIYLTKNKQFDAGPDFSVDIFADEHFAITDLNANGKSDLIFYVPGQSASGGGRARVYFSRGLVP